MGKVINGPFSDGQDDVSADTFANPRQPLRPEWVGAFDVTVLLCGCVEVSCVHHQVKRNVFARDFLAHGAQIIVPSSHEAQPGRAWRRKGATKQP